MPEGDTIHRAAARLRPVLAGHQLVRFEAPRLVGDRPALGEDIDDVLLDQRVAAGIGNVYKSDVCFLHGLHPFTPAGEVGDDELRRLFTTAHRLLVANLARSGRVTCQGGLAVYGRQGRPCRRCGTPVRMRHAGPMAHSTYWCPTCQPPRTL